MLVRPVGVEPTASEDSCFTGNFRPLRVTSALFGQHPERERDVFVSGTRATHPPAIRLAPGEGLEPSPDG